MFIGADRIADLGDPHISEADKGYIHPPAGMSILPVMACMMAWTGFPENRLYAGLSTGARTIEAV